MNIQRNLFTGILILIPLWVTWLVFKFIFVQLSDVGRPGIIAISKASRSEILSNWLLDPWFQSLLAMLMTLVLLYILGWLATKVIGRRFLGFFDYIIQKIPVVHTIYGAVKKLIGVLQSKPENIQRVVLIAFPNPNMRTVGFVTKVIRDEKTDKELAVVYVPTTPNPTSGYMEIVPLEDLISTDWSMDEAMTFILSAGAISPDRVNFTV